MFDSAVVKHGPLAVASGFQILTRMNPTDSQSWNEFLTDIADPAFHETLALAISLYQSTGNSWEALPDREKIDFIQQFLVMTTDQPAFKPFDMADYDSSSED